MENKLWKNSYTPSYYCVIFYIIILYYYIVIENIRLFILLIYNLKKKLLKIKLKKWEKMWRE